MEPVPVTRKVRRTVRLAVALVVGQAMLCALIGWLTLGKSRPEPAHPRGSSVVDALAAPPTPPAVLRTSRAAAAPTTRARQDTSAPARPAAPRRSTSASATETVAPTRTPVPIEAPPEDPAIVPPAPPALSPPSSAEVQEPVRVGDECRPAGARGRTAESEDVRCVREWPRRLRWRTV